MKKTGGNALPVKRALKNLFFYGLSPALILWLIVLPAGDAVRRSDAVVFPVLLAAAGVVVLNWFVYYAARKKRPTLLVFSYGTLCLLAVLILLAEALPGSHPLRSTLAVVGGHLAIASLFLFSLWCASRRNKAAHSAAVVIWVLLGLTLCFMIYSVIRDFEGRCVSLDTWINLGSICVFLLVFSMPRILSVRRRSALRRRAAGLAEGRIVQIVGETHLDRDGDLVTLHHARVCYTVGDVSYETRAEISAYAVRRFERKAFIGRSLLVHYDPADPASAYADRIDRHFFDPQPGEPVTDPPV